MIAARTTASQVGDRVLVVADGQATPLLEQAEDAFDDVAALAPVGVVRDGPPQGTDARRLMPGPKP
jgi:hypothetical protein